MKKNLTAFCLVFVTLFIPGADVLAQNKDVFQKVDTFLQAKFEKGNIPGFAVAIVSKDSILFSKGYGRTGDNIPVTGNSTFAIASLSKGFTAMAVMKLVESGRVMLDDPIRKYITGLGKNGHEITIRQLLNQTSGYSDLVFPELSFRQQPPTLEAAVDRMKNIKTVSKPGEKFHYHNPNYHILARLVEVVSGEGFSRYLDKNILKPLEMTNSSSVTLTKDLYSIPGLNYDPGHIYFFGRPVKMKEPDWFIEGSAGMISTVNDMGRWMMMNLNGGNYKGRQLLSPEGIAKMQTPYPGGQYAMGWIKSDDNVIRHTGILWTSQADEMLIKDKGYGVVVLFNSGLSAFQDYNAFGRGIYEILNGETPEVSAFATIAYDILVGLLAIMAILISVRRLTRTKKWENNYRSRPKVQSWTWIIARLMPLALLLSIPSIGTYMSGRVLSWERIILAMPSIFILLSIVAALNLVIVVVRLVKLRGISGKL
jgi:CubicO group peptidase (beta-lactamase class C family)